MTIRQYAEQLKSALGTSLGLYEAVKDSVNPTPTDAAIQLLNALPQSALNTFPSFFGTTGAIAAFVIASGPVLEQIAPVTA